MSGVISDASRPPAERADAVHDLLGSTSDLPALPVGADVIDALARRHGAREALAAALHADDAHRRAALEAAVAHWQGSGDEQLTSALVALGRTERAMASLRDEFRSKASQRPAPSRMHLGAWGIHLLKVFSRLGADRFEAFVKQAWQDDDQRGPLIGKALRAASVDGDLASLRKRLLGLIDGAIMEARTGQSLDDFLGGR